MNMKRSLLLFLVVLLGFGSFSTTYYLEAKSKKKWKKRLVPKKVRKGLKKRRIKKKVRRKAKLIRKERELARKMEKPGVKEKEYSKLQEKKERSRQTRIALKKEAKEKRRLKKEKRRKKRET